MTPVTTAVPPAIPVPRLGSRSREPTCRRNLAAVAVVTATWNAPDGPWATAPPGREPATSLALPASALRYSSSSWGGAMALSGGCPDTKNWLEPAAMPDHCAPRRRQRQAVAVQPGRELAMDGRQLGGAQMAVQLAADVGIGQHRGLRR